MIYKFKATIPGSKVFMREYEIEGSSTLYEFNDFLTDDLGFSPDQMIIFKGENKYGESFEYGLFDMGDGSIDEISIEKAIEKRGITKLQYIYDVNRQNYIELQFMGKEEEQQWVSYPRLVAEKGHNPEQFADKYEDFEHFGDIIDEEMGETAIGEDELPEGSESYE